MIFGKEELELMADKVNNEYFPERLEKPIMLDPYDLLDKLGCSYNWKYISPDKSILGMTFFDNGVWYIWPSGKYKDGDKYSKEFFPKQTILINQTVLDGQKNRYEENFIVAHEAGHWIKDKDYFEHNPDSVSHICKKNDMEKTYWYQGMTELEIIERQTNYLGAAILMPRDVLKAEFFRLLRYKNIPQNPLRLQKFMFGAIYTLSKTFNVNFNPVKYRLMDIGVLER